LQWYTVSSLNPGTSFNFLTGVAAVSANDVWAVGDYVNGSGAYQTLTMHWNGSVWSAMPTSPNQGTGSNHLNGVAAVAANDVWAVSNYTNGSVNQTLTMHLQGRIWNIMPSPNPGTSLNVLEGVAAVSANDVWAVGYSFNGGSSVNQTL